MKIIHQNGYTPEELYTWKTTVYKNVIESAQTLITAIRKYNYQYENPQNEVNSHIYFFIYKIINRINSHPFNPHINLYSLPFSFFLPIPIHLFPP